MKSSSKSKATGEQKDVAGNRPLDTQSSKEEHPSSTSAMSENSQSQKSQIGFQPTEALGEIDDTTANVQLLTAFASKLGALVFWKRLELGDGQEVIALCFPLGIWGISPNGALVAKKKES